MSTLYLDRKNLTVKLDGHTMALYEAGEKRGTVPLKLLERVVIRGNINLESRLLCALGENNVDVLFLTGRHSHNASMAFSHSHADARRRLAQYRFFFDHEQQVAMARELVLGKAKKQRQLLSEALNRRPNLRRVLLNADKSLAEIERKTVALPSEGLSVEQLRGFEGAAAAVYFSAYKSLFAASLDFSQRRRRPPPDPVNACLSLGYTLLHYEAVGICHQVGLDPLLGFYHEPAYGRESLACDLIEPLRPRLDALVWLLFRDRVLRTDHFCLENERCLLNKSGRKIFYSHYEQFVQPVRRLLRLQGYQLAQRYLQTTSEVL